MHRRLITGCPTLLQKHDYCEDVRRDCRFSRGSPLSVTFSMSSNFDEILPHISTDGRCEETRLNPYTLILHRSEMIGAGRKDRFRYL